MSEREIFLRYSNTLKSKTNGSYSFIFKNGNKWFYQDKQGRWGALVFEQINKYDFVNDESDAVRWLRQYITISDEEASIFLEASKNWKVYIQESFVFHEQKNP